MNWINKEINKPISELTNEELGIAKSITIKKINKYTEIAENMSKILEELDNEVTNRTIRLAKELKELELIDKN